MTASTCSLRSGHQSCIRAEFPSLQVFGSYVHLSLTRSSSSFVCCAFKPALWTAPCSSSTQPLMSSWSLGKKKKKKTNPLQGAATMTEYVQVINPHYTTRSTGPISRGYVWGGCGRGVFRSGTRSQWGQEGVPTTTERRSASAQTQHTFRWGWSSSGSRATQKEQRLNRGSGGFLHLGGGTGDRPLPRPSVEITARTPSRHAHPPIPTIDVTELHFCLII